MHFILVNLRIASYQLDHIQYPDIRYNYNKFHVRTLDNVRASFNLIYYFTRPQIDMKRNVEIIVIGLTQ